MSGPFPSPIQTERLRLERCCFDTLDPRRLYEVRSADDGIETVAAFLPWGPGGTLQDAYSLLRTAESEWEAGETARYVIRPRDGEPDAGAFAGLGQLVADWDRRSAMLGIWLRKPFWGRTYSTEHDAAMTELALGHLELDLLEVKANVDNEPSRRAIERLVERFDGRGEGRLPNQVAYDDGEVVTQYRYTIERERWLAATDGGTDVID